MSEYYHIVPWYNCDEWHKTYNEIYSESSNKQEALNLLLLWKARCPSLPSGIESTLCLLQVQVQDLKNTDELANDNVLRLAYSSAIMRFVNHMLDAETARGSSLYQAAKSLGVPDWIVDLRHDTAHSNNLPSLILLREASFNCLQWLKINYWDKYKLYIQDYKSGQKEIDNSNEGKISALMNFCISLSFCAHSKLKKINKIPNPTMRDSILNDAKDLFGDQIDVSDLKSISVPGLINKMNENSKKLLKSKNAPELVNNALLGDESIFLSLELLDYLSDSQLSVKKKLNKGYVQSFEVLLTFLHTNELLQDFIMALINITQTDENSQTATLAALWLSEILIALRKTKQFIKRLNKVNPENVRSKNKKDLKLLYHHWFPNETTKCLMLDLQKPVPKDLTSINYLQPIISAYNPYLTYFIRDLLNLAEPQLPALTLEKIYKLAKLIAQPEKFPVSLTTKVYTVEDLKTEDIEPISKDASSIESENMVEVTKDTNEILSNIWKPASSEITWTSCPIGSLQCLNNTEIPMETDM